MSVAVGAGSCARARRALSLVLDGEAEASEAETLAAHLACCGACRSFALDVSAFTKALRTIVGRNERGERA